MATMTRSTVEPMKMPCSSTPGTAAMDAAGVLRQEWRKVRVPGHVENVLQAALSL